MFESKETFRVKGSNPGECLESIAAHVETRMRVIQNANKKKYGFGSGDPLEGGTTHINATVPGIDITVNPQAYFDSINNSQTRIGCQLATMLTFYGAIGKWMAGDAVRSVDAWIPGDLLYIENAAYVRGEWDEVLEGENAIYVGVEGGEDRFWGHILKGPGKQTKWTLPQWNELIRGWQNKRHSKSGLPVVQRMVTYPAVGLE